MTKIYNVSNIKDASQFPLRIFTLSMVPGAFSLTAYGNGNHHQEISHKWANVTEKKLLQFTEQ